MRTDEAAARAARNPQPQMTPVQVTPIEARIVAQGGGAGKTPDGKSFIRVLGFPFQLDVILDEATRRAVVEGLTGVALP